MKKNIFLLLISMSYTQVSDNAYTHAGVSAMAGAVVAESGNIWSIFHNPAGITELRDNQFTLGGGNLFSYNWLPTSHLSVNTHIPVIGKFAFSFEQLKTKYRSSTLSKEQTISIAQGFSLQHDKNSHLAIGYTANFVIWEMGKSAGVSGDGSDGIELGNTNAMTLDIGVLATLREKYRFGVMVNNTNSGALGKGITRQVLPRRINIGITYLPLEGLATSIVTEKLLGREELQMKGAFRYNFNSHLIIYSGAQSNPNRFGFGFTFYLNKQSVSYGLLTHPVLPITHQFNIGISL